MALTTLNLSGIKVGDSLNISVSQGGLTAGPYSVGSWGGGDGGTVTITVRRSNLKVAPDSVGFGVDLSAATFDTTGPTGSEKYDARLHDLYFYWNFDDAGTWNVPVNVLAAWKNRSLAKGPFVTHMFDTPRPASGGAGTGYDVSLMVYEPSSGKVAMANVEVFVENPDVVFAGAQTICINPVGDSDFSDKPTGAQEVNLDKLMAFYNDVAGTTSTIWDDERKSAANVEPPLRWLFKRGGDFRLYLDFYASDIPRMTFGAYGDPLDARPIVRMLEYADAPSLASRYIFVPFPQWGNHPSYGGMPPELRLVDIDFQGNFDPTSEAPPVTRNDADGGVFFSASRNTNLMVHNCRCSGFAGSTFYVGNQNISPQVNFHINDTLITDFGGQYPLYSMGSTDGNSSASVTGCGIVQNPNGSQSTLTRAPIRFQSLPLIHMRGTDFFHTDPSQPCFKVLDAQAQDGLTVNIHSCSLEGGLWPIHVAGNSTSSTPDSLGRIGVQNVVIDGLVVVGACRTQAFINTRATGLTVRNCLFIQPATPAFNDHLGQLVLIDSFVGDGAFDATIVGAAPIAIYNNTFRVDRTSEQNFDNTIAFFTDETPQGLTNLIDNNNVLHFPNLDTPITASAPVTDTALWEARNIGLTDTTDFTLDPSYATPAGSVKDTKPTTGSSAIGGATTGLVARDSLGAMNVVRDDSPSKGAYEPA